MKPKDIRIVALILVAVMIGGVLWWFIQGWPMFVDIQIHPGSAVKPNTPKMVVQAVQAPQVEFPKASTAPVENETAGSHAQAVLLAQAELKSTVQDMARIMREKGKVALAIAYGYPQDFIANQPPNLVQRMLDDDAKKADDPQEQSRRENVAETYDLLATLTPVINSTADKATYYGKPNPDGTPQRLARFHKINGKWYWVPYLGDDPSDPYP